MRHEPRLPLRLHTHSRRSLPACHVFVSSQCTTSIRRLQAGAKHGLRNISGDTAAQRAKDYGHKKVVQMIASHVRAALAGVAAPAKTEEGSEALTLVGISGRALAAANRGAAEARAAADAAAKKLADFEAAEAPPPAKEAAVQKAEAELHAAVKSRQLHALKDAIAAHVAAGAAASPMLATARKMRDELTLAVREKAAEEKKLRQKQEKEEKRMRMAEEEARKKAVTAAATAQADAKAAEEEAAAKVASEAEAAKAARASARKEAEAAEKAARAAKVAARKEAEAAAKAEEKAVKAAADKAEAEKVLRAAKPAARKEEEAKTATREEEKKKAAEAASAAVEAQARANEVARLATADGKNEKSPSPPLASEGTPPLPSSAVTVADAAASSPYELDLPSQLCQWCTIPALPPTNLMAATRSFSAARTIGTKGGLGKGVLAVVYRADALVQPTIGTHPALFVLSRPLAVKQLVPLGACEHGARVAAAAAGWQLLNEAAILSRCSHPNVLPLLGHSSELLSLVYPLASGGNV